MNIGREPLPSPTQLDLSAGDVAMIVREDGALELCFPSDNKPVNDAQLLLVYFAAAFFDERVQNLLVDLNEEMCAIKLADSGG
jgi:hypothetical protein